MKRARPYHFACLTTPSFTCAALAPGGVFIWTTGGLDKPEEKRDSAMGPPVYYSVLGMPKTLQTVSAAGCVCRHLEYD